MSTASFEADEVFDDKRHDDSSASLNWLKTTRFQTTSTKTLAIMILQFVTIMLLEASWADNAPQYYSTKTTAN